MGVLALHQFDKIGFYLINDKFPLRSVTVLEQRLQDTAAVMLVAKLCVLFSDELDTLCNEHVLLSVGKFSLLHHQLVVVDSQIFNQI